MRPVLFADDRQFWFETLRILGHAAYGGSDIGEVLTTAEAITSGDYDSWHDAWRATADRVAAQAEDSLAAGHRVSARDGMLRAATYYSTAEFFLHGNPDAPDDPRINDAYERGAACFATAAGLYRPVWAGWPPSTAGTTRCPSTGPGSPARSTAAAWCCAPTGSMWSARSWTTSRPFPASITTGSL
ncbi:hypothetical protein ACFWCA_12985 [Streptomyces phaeochromogenes]|uniref:hypothetical protein n=1 Tax=Streptomyces phaeochromogenes TaxID=1923 RepID=UPI00367D6868